MVPSASVRKVGGHPIESSGSCLNGQIAFHDSSPDLPVPTATSVSDLLLRLPDLLVEAAEQEHAKGPL